MTNNVVPSPLSTPSFLSAATSNVRLPSSSSSPSHSPYTQSGVSAATTVKQKLEPAMTAKYETTHGHGHASHGITAGMTVPVPATAVSVPPISSSGPGLHHHSFTLTPAAAGYLGGGGQQHLVPSGNLNSFGQGQPLLGPPQTGGGPSIPMHAQQQHQLHHLHPSLQQQQQQQLLLQHQAGGGSPGSVGYSYTQTQMDPMRASVTHLLAKASSMPCFSAAQAFKHLVQPTVRFQLALDVMLPLLEHDKAELPQRILVSFILYSLYTPHPITVNPFKSALYDTYVREKEKAVGFAREGGSSLGTAPNEQLVWVLWKILKGDGNEIGTYPPTTLARSPLPPKLRAVNLNLDDQLNSLGEADDISYPHSPNQSHSRNGAQDDEVATTEQVRASGVPTAPDPAFSAIATAATMNGMSRASSVNERDEMIVHGVQLLLMARERVLTLAEQRQLLPLIPELTASPRMITSLDLHPIVALNPTLAHPVFVGLLLNSKVPESTSQSNGMGAGGISTTTTTLPSPFLEILPFLPPTLPTFDLMGKLLRDRTVTPSGSTVAEIVQQEVLGRFIHECVNWVERAEREEREGMVSDDRVAKSVQMLCRFYGGLIKLGIVKLGGGSGGRAGVGGRVGNASGRAAEQWEVDSVETTEMVHFSLRFSRFEEANHLYRMLAMGRF